MAIRCRLFIRVDGERITDVKYLIRGCPAAMAVASALSELAKGKPVEDALFITDDDVVEALGGLPEIKLHCSNLGASALQLGLERLLREEDQQTMKVMTRFQRDTRTLQSPEQEKGI